MKFKKFVLSNYNDKSQKFIITWVGIKNVLCVKQCHSRKDEHLVFYRCESGIRVCVLTLSYSKNNGSCFFGDLNHLARVIYCQVFGFELMPICYWYDRQKMKRIEKYISNYIGLANIY